MGRRKRDELEYVASRVWVKGEAMMVALLIRVLMWGLLRRVCEGGLGGEMDGEEKSEGTNSAMTKGW